MEYEVVIGLDVITSYSIHYTKLYETYLYFAKMNIYPENPKLEDRDRLVLSKGHCAPALYSVLANRGFFDVSELKTLRHIGSMLQGHPDMKHIPGVDRITSYNVCYTKLLRVLSVAVKVGELSAVETESLRFCFDFLTKGTLAEGARLEIERVQVTCHCQQCGSNFTRNNFV